MSNKLKSKEMDVSATKAEGTTSGSSESRGVSHTLSSTASAVSEAASKEVRKKPIMTFHEGVVSAALWGREVQVDGKPVTMCSVTFEREYRDRNDNRRFTPSLNLSDMAHLISLARAVEEYGKGLRQSESNQNA